MKMYDFLMCISYFLLKIYIKKLIQIQKTNKNHSTKKTLTNV